MILGPLHEEYSHAIAKAIREAEATIASGKLATLEAYKAKCARIAGLREALELFKSVAKRHGEYDEGD